MNKISGRSVEEDNKMLNDVPHESHVPGVEISVTYCDENIAQPGQGDDLLKDGILQVLVEITPASGAVQDTQYIDIRIVQTKADEPVDCVTDGSFILIPLESSQELREVVALNTCIDGKWGAWVLIKFSLEEMEGSFIHAICLWQVQSQPLLH